MATGLRVEVKRDEKVQKALARLAKESLLRFKDLVNETAINVEAEAKRNVVVDTGRLRSSILLEMTAGGLAAKVGTNVKYAPFIEFGTNAHKSSKGHDDFVNNMLDWGRRHGMTEGEAWAVIKSIQRNGTKPRPFLVPAFIKHRDQIVKKVKQILRDLK